MKSGNSIFLNDMREQSTNLALAFFEKKKWVKYCINFLKDLVFTEYFKKLIMQLRVP